MREQCRASSRREIRRRCVPVRDGLQEEEVYSNRSYGSLSRFFPVSSLILMRYLLVCVLVANDCNGLQQLLRGMSGTTYRVTGKESGRTGDVALSTTQQKNCRLLANSPFLRQRRGGGGQPLHPHLHQMASRFLQKRIVLMRLSCTVISFEVVIFFLYFPTTTHHHHLAVLLLFLLWRANQAAATRSAGTLSSNGANTSDTNSAS